jgi:hypothetical protein
MASLADKFSAAKMHNPQMIPAVRCTRKAMQAPSRQVIATLINETMLSKLMMFSFAVRRTAALRLASTLAGVYPVRRLTKRLFVGRRTASLQGGE